jgi:hypothetical protein
MKSVVGKLKKRLSPSKEEQPYINWGQDEII